MRHALARLRQHPTGFWYVFWGELAERASFYGMRTLLALYLIDVLRFEQGAGGSVMQFFLAACYVTPLLGGWLADRWLGRFRTIAIFAVPYVAGHLILGGFESRAGLFVALPLHAQGSGAIKPNTSTLMGMIYEEQKKTALLGQAFSWFYAAINVGSALSSLGLPLVRDRWGHGVAFAVPAALMAVAFGLFALGRRHYPREERRAAPTSTERAAARTSIRKLAGVFALIAIFWFVYDQSASTWIFFARDHLDLTLFPGVTLTPDQIQGLNPIMILALTPAFNALWAHLKRRKGAAVPDTTKMLFGFLIVVGAMATMAFAGYLAGDGKVTVWWMVLATLVITMAELCISVVGLEFAFRSAAPGTKSAVTAAFLLMVFIGNTIGGFFAPLYQVLSAGTYFALQTGIIAVAALAFVWVARRFDEPNAAREEPLRADALA